MRSVVPLLAFGALAALLPLPAAAQSFSPTPINTTRPDLTASLTASADTVAGGAEVTYTLTVRNVGQQAFREFGGNVVYFNAPASGIAVLQTLPPGATFRSVTPSGGFSCANVAPVVSCTGGSLESGASASIAVRVSAPLGAGSFASTASIDPTNSIVERDDQNNTATTTIVVPQPDLVMRVVTSDTTVEDGATYKHYLRVENAGPGAEASGVSIRYAMPPGVQWWSYHDGETSWLYGTQYAAGFTCSRSGDVITCSGGRIASGATGSVALSIGAPATHGQITSTATVDPSDTIAERNETNNLASVTTTVVGRPDLVAAVEHNTLPPFKRIVTVRNAGAGPATNVKVVIEATKWEYFDDGPADQLLAIIPDSGFSCTWAHHSFSSYLNYNSGQDVTCTGGTIAAGSTATIAVWHWLTTTDDSRNTDVRVDPDGQIRERWENNNEAEAHTRI
jgi:hypothetical protein